MVAEEVLWRSLHGSKFQGLKFRHQVPIGKYVVDFLCIERRFIVEPDGPPHEKLEHDAVRDAWLREHGYKVFRIQNDVIIGGGDIALDMIRDAMLKDGG